MREGVLLVSDMLRIFEWKSKDSVDPRILVSVFAILVTVSIFFTRNPVFAFGPLNFYAVLYFANLQKSSKNREVYSFILIKTYLLMMNFGVFVSIISIQFDWTLKNSFLIFYFLFVGSLLVFFFINRRSPIKGLPKTDFSIGQLIWQFFISVPVFCGLPFLIFQFLNYFHPVDVAMGELDGKQVLAFLLVGDFSTCFSVVVSCFIFSFPWAAFVFGFYRNVLRYINGAARTSRK